MKRESRTTRTIGPFLIACLASVPAAWGQSGEEVALQAVIEVETAMLDESRERFDTVSRRNRDVQGEVALIRDALASAVHQDEAPDHRRVQQLAEQLERAEAARSALLRIERALVDRIGQHLQRLELFEAQLESLQGREEQGEGLLSGSWDLVLMPSGQRGTAVLQQTGALVNGTYRLEGGWTGSLQGTLVNRKVFLVRIDSKLGKSMELEGFLSGDAKRIRGSWLNYELAGGEEATGHWTAERRGASE